MKLKVHLEAAKAHFKVAEEFDNKLNKETDTDLRVAWRVVASQNYFYSIINAIESVFTDKLEEHSFSHENRMRKLLENRSLFDQEIIELYEEVDRNLRNKVAYRGENGDKYKTIKKLANLLKEKW